MCLYYACRDGSLDVIHLIIRVGSEQGISFDWNGYLEEACQGNHRPIINFLIEKGANQWQNGLRGACLGGHFDLIQLMLQYGARDGVTFDWNDVLLSAVSSNNREILTFVLSHKVTRFDKAFGYACERYN